MFPVNAPAVGAFLRVANQWRCGPTGTPYALDHGAVWPVLAALGRPHDLDLFDRLRVLEGEALKHLRLHLTT